ncbi:MAG: hypothetical protein RLZZ561_1576 [Pseudomonadota bacterium]|jgi:hypothetical protein
MVDSGVCSAIPEREDVWVSIAVDVANLAVEGVVANPALGKAEVGQIRAWIGKRAIDDVDCGRTGPSEPVSF